MHEPEKRTGAEPPVAAYNRLLDRNRAQLLSQERRDRYFIAAKIAVAFAAAGVLLRFLHAGHGIWLLWITAVLFAVLAVAHERVLRAIRVTKLLIAFYQQGIARLEDRWAGTGEGGERFLDPVHPYARDLDLFGKGSIFELLCTCRTRAGEETLARWLLEPATPEEVINRQTAVEELRNRIGFRERLFLAGGRVRAGVHPDALTAWGEGARTFGSRSLFILLPFLALVWVAAGIYSVAAGSYDIFFALCIVNAGVGLRLRKRLGASIDAIEETAKDLRLLSEVLIALEQEDLRSLKLRNLQAALKTDGIPPSSAVKRLSRIVQWIEARRNMLVRFFDGFIFYSALLTLMTEGWRSKFGPSIRGWLAVVGEMETLVALAGYAFEHPEHRWPEFVDTTPWFEAESFAHPLLPDGKAIPNDLHMGAGLQLIVLSGPNMSGKSTFVRGIGVNAVLAQCGAPVRAKRLRMSPLAVGASICVLDSLQGGVSRFYAEIKRLKLITDMAQGPSPVLFLLDELLSGTNSNDRLAGTKYLVNALVELGAIGLVTTHDLALARIPESMNGNARNLHFEDHLEDGRLVFDFKLRPGVVQTGNALRLMQTIGLVRE
jgi:hypothetical protein